MYNYPPPSGYPPYGYPVPPRRRNWLPWILGGVALLVVIVVGVSVLVYLAQDTRRGVEITYEVSGTAESVDISYTGLKDSERAEHVSLPWTKSVTIGPSVVFVSLMVTSFESGGSFSCRILADGKQIAQSGPTQMIVSCFGSSGNKWAPG